MDPKLLFVIAIAELVAKYGIPAVLEIIQTWQKTGDITVEDINKLRDMVPPTDTYFKGNSFKTRPGE